MAEEIKKVESSPVEMMEELKGTTGEGEIIISKKSGKYVVLPCSLSDIPKLFNKFSDWQKPGKEETAFGEDKLMLMAEIASMGLVDKQPDMTPEVCLKKLTLSDFTKILKIMMDLNDFFVGMREIVAIQNAATAKSGK